MGVSALAMSSIGTGYDLYTTSYSPDGRVFQVEYAAKAVESSGTAVGVRCKDGVVMGFEKLVVSKMLVEGSSRRIFTVSEHVGLAVCGLLADGRQLVNRARDEAAARGVLRQPNPWKGAGGAPRGLRACLHD